MELAAQNEAGCAGALADKMEPATFGQRDPGDLTDCSDDAPRAQRLLQRGKHFLVIRTTAEDHPVRVEAEAGKARREWRFLPHRPKDHAGGAAREKRRGKAGCRRAGLSIPCYPLDLMDRASRQAFWQKALAFRKRGIAETR